MKHIVPKPIKLYNTSIDTNEISKLNVPEKSKKVQKEFFDSKTYKDDYDLMAFTSSKQLVFGFDYLYKGDKKFVPELNPCIIYFSSAQMFSKMIYEYKRSFQNNAASIFQTQKNSQTLDDSMAQFQTFFQFASSYIIMLSASLEAFINKIIPIDQTFITKEGKIKDINWILKESIDFKMLKIIPKITGKDFTKEHSKKYDDILYIKNFRNDFIHLSPKTAITNTKYKEFYRKVIDFEYSEAIYSIKHYINYHEEGLIEECTCGKEFYFDIIKK